MSYSACVFHLTRLASTNRPKLLIDQNSGYETKGLPLRFNVRAALKHLIFYAAGIKAYDSNLLLAKVVLYKSVNLRENLLKGHIGKLVVFLYFLHPSRNMLNTPAFQQCRALGPKSICVVSAK